MTQRRVVAVCCACFLIACAGSAAAQDFPQRFAAAVPEVPVPPGAGAWVLQVITVGGITGRGTEPITLTSEGANLAPLRDAVRQAPGWNWSGSAFGSTCSDCYSTLLVLTFRDDTGLARRYVAYWDPTTRARLAKDVARLHDMAVALRK
jgi:hypothetical protein